jgi:hypothetical protein
LFEKIPVALFTMQLSKNAKPGPIFSGQTADPPLWERPAKKTLPSPNFGNQKGRGDERRTTKSLPLFKLNDPPPGGRVVEARRLELLTYCLQSSRSPS